MDVPKETNESLMKEFLANWPEKDGDKVYIRRKWIEVTAPIINMIYNLDDYEDFEEYLLEDERVGINWGEVLPCIGLSGILHPG